MPGGSRVLFMDTNERVRKMNELEKARLAVSQANQAVLAASETIQKLVAENAALKKCCEAYDADGLAEYGDQWEVTPLETPATDAAIAEIKAQGLDEFAESLAETHSKTETGSRLEVQLAFTGDAVVWFAANLRAGRKG